MQCDRCAYNSADTTAPGPFLARHLQQEHGLSATLAIAESKAIRERAPTEIDTLRARVAELERAISDALTELESATFNRAPEILRAVLKGGE